MKYFLLLIFLIYSIVFPRSDCLQYAEKDALGRSLRPVKHTFAISPSGHFYIHYDTLGNEAPDLTDVDENGIPDYVDEVGIIADSAHFVLVNEMGWDEEPSDGDGGYDIYLEYYYSDKVYGFNYIDSYCTIPGITGKNSCIGSGGSWVPASYLEIDNDYTPQSIKSNFNLTPLQIMRISLAHEYFHGIQWGYEESLGSNAYFYEMTSMWFEDVLIPDGNDYLDGWVDPILHNPTATFYQPPDDKKGYCLALYGHYLSSFLDPKGVDNVKNSTIIREMWEKYKNTNFDAFYALENVLENNYGISFNETWTDFLSRNIFNGLYDNMDNPFYYYVDQVIVDPIQTTSTLITDSILVELGLDNESVDIESFRIGSLESIISIQHGSEEYLGRVAIVSNDNPEFNQLFWGSDTTVEKSFNNSRVHLVYGTNESSLDLPILITTHTVPLPPTNLLGTAAQDSIILSWDPSPGPGDSLLYVIYRYSDSIDISIDTNFVDNNIVEFLSTYEYTITCQNNIGESSPSNSISIISWPDKEMVIESQILKIYPNPISISKEITLLYALDTEYTKPSIDLYNIQGQLLNSIRLSSNTQGWHRENIHQILRQNPPSGIYFLRISPQANSSEAVKITILN